MSNYPQCHNCNTSTDALYITAANMYIYAYEVFVCEPYNVCHSLNGNMEHVCAQVIYSQEGKYIKIGFQKQDGTRTEFDLNRRENNDLSGIFFSRRRENNDLSGILFPCRLTHMSIACVLELIKAGRKSQHSTFIKVLSYF